MYVLMNYGNSDVSYQYPDFIVLIVDRGGDSR